MRRVLILSSHLDDAVLSCGSFIAGRGGNVDVLTVFSGVPMEKDLLTDYDKSCGFNSSKDAMVVRRQEDKEACAILNANPIHTNFLDSQYSLRDMKLVSTMFKDIDFSPYELILAPLGLRHPDHEVVTNAMLSIRPRLDNLYLYEDLPARVTHPELVEDALYNASQPHRPTLEFIGDGPIELKVRALWCYKSQMGRGDLNPYNLYVPERFHHVK